MRIQARLLLSHDIFSFEKKPTTWGRGGGDDDDALITFKTIHFNQHLVQGLLTFVVTTTQTGATLATDRIDLINEDDAGGGFLGLFEHVTHTGGTDTHEHFHEVRT